MKTLSIIIPVFNEEKTILSVIKKVESAEIGDLNKELIIIDDCSTDKTKQILEDLPKNTNYRVLFKEKNFGKGDSVKRGMKLATGDYVIIQDADMEYDPDEYVCLLNPLLQNKADVVFGSRFVGDRAHRVLFFWHYVGNKFLTLLSNVFTNLNLTDMETCYKIFTKDAVKKIIPEIRSKRFGIEPEVTVLVSEFKLRVYEVGISYSGRTYEDGKKIGWKDGFVAIWTIFKTKSRFIFRRK